MLSCRNFRSNVRIAVIFDKAGILQVEIPYIVYSDSGLYTTFVTHSNWRNYYNPQKLDWLFPIGTVVLS